MAAAILKFRLPVSRRRLADSAIEFPDPENMGVAVGISLLSCIEAEIQVLPVGRRHLEFLTSGVDIEPKEPF